ncbi:hypothetical protein ACKP2L_05440 [Oenococcus alcoholitolerans]|uniref:hypothetical protein n=1 Tax=Oenococcus alcoholitolerans TaxID=931074 RepID=UPI003F6FB6E1
MEYLFFNEETTRRAHNRTNKEIKEMILRKAKSLQISNNLYLESLEIHKRLSKPVIATYISTGEEIEFSSVARATRKFGHDVRTLIKSGKPMDGYIWRKK